MLLPDARIGVLAATAELAALKEERPEYADIYSQVLQDVLRRLDKALPPSSVG